MIRNIDDIKTELTSGTLAEHLHENLELKASWREENGERLSALANRLEFETGWMVIGVTDGGALVGRDENWARNTEEVVSQHINQRLDPIQAHTSLSCLQLSGSWILVLSVKGPGAVVYWNSVAYKRAGTTIQEMKPDEVLELTIKLPGLTDYSKQPWDGHVNEMLVNAYSRAVATRHRDGWLTSSETLNSAQILARLGLSGKNTSRILFGNSGYRVVTYDLNGNPQQNVPHKGLFGLLGEDFISSIQQKAQQQLNSLELPFPELALRESLANAVAHAAYFESDGDVVIEVFPEHIVISNLCLPESRYFANKWFSRSRKTVNNLLMETLRLAGFVDELGRGKNLIFRESIVNGKKPPQVVVERAGRYDRWRLYLYGGTRDPVQLKLLRRIQDLYSGSHKALIAYALVLWRDQPISQIRNYIDGESLSIFAEVLADLNGPIFYWQEQDQIVLRRWARVLLDEGKDSKSLTPAEEIGLYDFAYDMRTRFHHGMFSPKDLRKLGAMGETPSERNATSNLLSKWVVEQKIRKVRKGVYEFVPKPAPAAWDYDRLLALLQSTPEANP
jgi:predicted HTH transcriptional regulator